MTAGDKGKKKSKKKNLYRFIPLGVASSDAKSCLLSMRALSTITYIQKLQYSCKHYTNTDNNINKKLCTDKRFKSYINTKYHQDSS